MLQIDHVTRRFSNGVTALQDVALTIGTGDFVALLGPSGCGKTSLLRLIAGLDLPDAGALRWAEGRPELGYVFQDSTLLPWADAADNVWLPLRLRGMSRAEAATQVATALDQVGLSGFAQARPQELSGGMRMRVSVARALVGQPRVLLMDEPFAALDEFTRHTLQDDLLALWQRLGCTIVFVTHSLYEAAFLARRIVLMSPRPGRIAQEIISKVPPGARLSPEYAALVSEITQALRPAA